MMTGVPAFLWILLPIILLRKTTPGSTIRITHIIILCLLLVIRSTVIPRFQHLRNRSPLMTVLNFRMNGMRSGRKKIRSIFPMIPRTKTVRPERLTLLDHYNLRAHPYLQLLQISLPLLLRSLYLSLFEGSLMLTGAQMTPQD